MEVAANMVTRYDAALADDSTRHSIHRVSHYLLSCSAGCLGFLFRDYVKTGKMHTKLRSEITAYQLCMLDDSLVEGPHAKIGRSTRGAARSLPSWWSATIRLTQNMRVRADSGVADPGKFEWFYRHWKILAQRHQSKYARGTMKRTSIKRFLSLVYRMGEISLQDWSALGLHKLDIQVDKKQASRTNNPVRELQRDYVRCVLEKNKFYSAPRESNMNNLDTLGTGVSAAASSDDHDIIFQVVSHDMTHKKHVVTESMHKWRAMEVPATIQHYSRQRVDNDRDSGFTVYEEGHPEIVDLLKLGTWKQLSRSLTAWTHVESDGSDGGFVLSESQFVHQRSWNPLEPGVPVWKLLLFLTAQGWKRQAAPASHTPTAIKAFGMSGFVTRKAYLKCLCVLDELFQRGLMQLCSRQPMSYYKLVARSSAPATVIMGKTHVEYTQLLAIVGDPCDTSLRVAPGSGDEADDASVNREDSEGECSANLGVAGLSSKDSAQQHDSGRSLSSSVLIPPAPSDDALFDVDGPMVFHTDSSAPLVGGLRLDVHLEPGQRGHYRRWVMPCPLRHCQHVGGKYPCQRNRSMGPGQIAHFGQREPEAFLGCWAEAAHRFPSRARHMGWSPSVAQVREYIQRHGL